MSDLPTNQKCDNSQVGAVEKSDGHSPQVSGDAQPERKVSRRLELGASSTHVNGLTGMTTPAGTAPAPAHSLSSKKHAADGINQEHDADGINPRCGHAEFLLCVGEDERGDQQVVCKYCHERFVIKSWRPVEPPDGHVKGFVYTGELHIVGHAGMIYGRWVRAEDVTAEPPTASKHAVTKPASNPWETWGGINAEIKSEKCADCDTPEACAAMGCAVKMRAVEKTACPICGKQCGLTPAACDAARLGGPDDPMTQLDSLTRASTETSARREQCMPCDCEHDCKPKKNIGKHCWLSGMHITDESGISNPNGDER